MKTPTDGRPSSPQPVGMPIWTWLLILISGPGLFILAFGLMLWTAVNVTAVADATIVAVETHVSSGQSRRTEYTPIFEWEVNDRTLRATNKFSSDDADAYRVGQSIRIKYDPARPATAVPDTFWAMYGVELVLLGVSLVFTLPLLLRLGRRRPKLSASDVL